MQEEEARRPGRSIATQGKIPTAVGLLEQAQDLLKEVGDSLPDPSGKVERERDLDPELDVDPVETGVVIRCVSHDYLRPAIDDLRELMRSKETGESAAEKEVA